MKFATLPDGSYDGRLVLVDDRGIRLPRRENQTVRIGTNPLRGASVPPGLAPNLWTALQMWDNILPELDELDAMFKDGELRGQPLDGMAFRAPLPRTTSWLDGSAFLSHVRLVRKARNAAPPEDLETVPLMYQGVGDPIFGPTDPILISDEAHGADLEAEVAVLLDHVPMGTKAADAAQHIKLITIMNDVSLRNLIPRELAAGFGFFHGKPPSSMAPYAVTPDELGSAWKDGRLHLKMRASVNGKALGEPDCSEMHFSFPDLIAHAAKTRPLPAGTVLGSGTVANADSSKGCGCLAEVRTLEQLKGGQPTTPFLRNGDRVHIEVLDNAGRSVFGAIDQQVVLRR